MDEIIAILKTWLSGVGNGLTFFGGVLKEVFAGVDTIMFIMPDLPYFLTSLIAIGLFCVVGNIVLKII